MDKPSASKKRQVIDDYFNSTAKRHCQFQCLSMAARNDRLPKEPEKIVPGLRTTSVPGLTILEDFITVSEEQEILKLLNDPTKCTWRTDLSRRTMHFGGTYCLMPPKTTISQNAKPQVVQAPSMPEELSWLLQRFVDLGVFPDKKRPQYCIVNEYTGNLGISAHTENFQFAEPVVGLSLLSSCPIRFHELTNPFDGSVRSGKAGKAERTRATVDLGMPGRSLLVMRGESRWKWQHEIVRSTKGRDVGWKRVSLTFRYKNDR